MSSGIGHCKRICTWSGCIDRRSNGVVSIRILIRNQFYWERCHVRSWVVILSVVLLYGCATDRILYEDSGDGLAKMQSYATTEPAVLQERWGPLAIAAAGKNWIGSSEKRPAEGWTFEWILPGVVLKARYYFSADFLIGGWDVGSYNTRLQYDPTSGKIEFFNRLQQNHSYLWAEFAVQPDGTLLDKERDHKISINPDGSLVMFTGLASLRSVSDEDYARAYELTKETVKAKDKESSERGWATFGAIMTGLAQSTSQAATDYKKQQAQSSALNARIAQQSAEQQRQAQQQSEAEAQRQRQLALAQQQSRSGSASSQPAPALAATMTPVQVEQQVKRTTVTQAPPARPASSTATAPARSQSTAKAKTPQTLPGGSLKFVLFHGMRPGPKSTTNPMCISNVMTVPGPAGWNSGNGESNAETGAVNLKARAIVESYYPDFIQKCRQTIDGAMRTDLLDRPTFEWTQGRSNDAQAAYNEYRSGRRGKAAEHSFVNLSAH